MVSPPIAAKRAHHDRVPSWYFGVRKTQGGPEKKDRAAIEWHHCWRRFPRFQIPGSLFHTTAAVDFRLKI